MREITIVLICILFFFLPSVGTLSVCAQGEAIPSWNTQWSFHQEIIIPIKTNDTAAKYQPIDMHFTFTNPCWTKNENLTSIRICCWDGTQWHELESQIYDLSYKDRTSIDECSIVFLIPDFADGNERYYVYYDDAEKPQPNYMDHLNVEDAYYSYSPISDISATAQFYGIKEDGYCIYGVGQDGQLLDRGVAQVVVKQCNNSKEFDILTADQIVSFAFSYYYGSKEKDESSSDQIFISKRLFTDGNLMVEFGIISESKKKDIRTTAIYKYYYYPLNNKRLSVHVKHHMLEDATVQGIDNIDGRFGSIISFKSRSASLQQMNFGKISPYINFYGEDDTIKEYQMDLNPASKTREWIISYKDDADLGKEAWIDYGDGREGEANAVIFSSNAGIVQSGTDERDGIQLKVAEKEYFNFLGTEIDYTSINFGRNSYEQGSSHDTLIPSDFNVEFDAEVYASDTGGFLGVQREARLYQSLVKYRRQTQDPSFEREQKRYDLTVTTHLGGTRFSFPFLANRTGRNFPVMWIELCRDGKIIESGSADRFMGIRASKTFSQVIEGTYLIKVYWKLSNSTMFFRGMSAVNLYQKTDIQVWCTWQRSICAIFTNQEGKGLENVQVSLRNKDGILFAENITDANGEVIFKVPYSRKDTYSLKAMYHEFVLYNGSLPRSLRRLNVPVDVRLYTIIVEVHDELGLPPGVDITPILSTIQYNTTVQLTPTEMGAGRYLFTDLLSGDYTLVINYADVTDQHQIRVPDDGDTVSVLFSAKFRLIIDLFDSKGNPVLDKDIQYEIIREGTTIVKTDTTTVSIPPAQYRITAYKENKQIGITDVELTNDRHVKLVTILSSLIPTVIIGAGFTFICAMVVFYILKKLFISSLLKCIALGLLVIALMLPWWSLSGTSTVSVADRSIVMYLEPRVMIETTQYGGDSILAIAEMPEPFVNMLGIIGFLLGLSAVTLAVSVLLKKLSKAHYAFLLSVMAALFLLIIFSAFYIGTSKLTETSIGPVQGAGQLPITINNEEITLQTAWGFDSGFYLVLFASFITLLSTLLDVARIIKRKKKLLKRRK